MDHMMKQDREKPTRKARTTQNIKQRIPDELVLKAERTQDRIDKNFGEFMRKQDRLNIKIVQELFPIIRDSTHMSKLLNGTAHVSLGILVALHDVFDVDLNEFVAGDTAERPSLTPTQVETLREIVQMYDTKSSLKLQK